MEIAALSKLIKEVIFAGLILFDGTKTYNAPGDKHAAAIYNTGTRVEVLQEKSVPGTGLQGDERFYQIKRGTEPVWVQAKAVQIIAKEEAANELSLPFYLRAAKNKDAVARTLAARGLMRLMKAPELLAAWTELQRDQADEVRCAANNSLSERAIKEGLPADPRFNDALLDALLRVRREGGWGEKALCGLDGLLNGSSHPDKTALQCMLAQRHIGECPEQARPEDKARAVELLKLGLAHPEAWVRANTMEQLCGEELTDDAVAALSGAFPAMKPGDKAALISACAWRLRNNKTARPLLSRITALIGDKSQPEKLRLKAVDSALFHHDVPSAAIRKIVGDPRDELRFQLAGKYCQHKAVLEETAIHGDDAVFASALMCLDKLTPLLPGHTDSSLNDWSAPTLDAGLKTITNPERYAQLERRLKCLLGQALCTVTLPTPDHN